MMFSPFASTESRFTEGNAEPMNLGSPVSSPKSKANVNQNYLPPYLFGETSSPQTGATTWNSPKQQPSVFSPCSAPLSPATSFSQYRDPIYQSPLANSIINTPSAAKSGGPPVQGLLYTPTSPATFGASPVTFGASPATFGASAIFNNSQTELNLKSSRNPAVENTAGILTPSKSFSINNSTFMSPAQIDPFFTQGEALKNSEQLDEAWVTVFGFPAASADYILHQFSQYGNITEHKISPNGNWMHIKYQSKLQAKKALSKNGKIFSGNIMIGVKPCIEMDLMEGTKENSIRDISSPQVSVTSPLNDSLYRSENSTKQNLKNIRPLASAVQSPETPTQASSQKSEGIVSRALEYLWKL